MNKQTEKKNKKGNSYLSGCSFKHDTKQHMKVDDF